MSIYAPEELLNQTDFALEVAKNVLDFYEEYYGIKYPMNKSGRKCCLVLQLFREKNTWLLSCFSLVCISAQYAVQDNILMLLCAINIVI